MKTVEFAHQRFCASDWETKLKQFIDALDCSDGVIWHRKREHKKINEELATLGFYVKYKYGKTKDIRFSLNKSEGKADGWIFKDGEAIETIQIAIAHYEQEEAISDRMTMNGEEIVVGGWVADRIKLLYDRVKIRITNKKSMDYHDIDTLLIGVRDWFVRKINTEYPEHKANLVHCMEDNARDTQFKQFAVVDTDFIGEGEVLIVPNIRLKTYDHSQHWQRALSSHIYGTSLTL